MLMSPRRYNRDRIRARRILFLIFVATSTTVIANITVAIVATLLVVVGSLRSADASSSFVNNNQRIGIGCNMRSTVSSSFLWGVAKGAFNCGGMKQSSVIQRNMMSPSSLSTTSVVASYTTTTTSHREILQPLVVCGPSGVGKGTIISRFMEIANGKKSEDLNLLPEFKFSVSHTTRLPRNGEIHGVHYHFVTKEYMLSKINNTSSNSGINDNEETTNNNNFFVEYAQVHGNLYGTSFQSVYDASSSSSSSSVLEMEDANDRRRQRECLLDIDVKGVRSIKEFQLRQQREVREVIDMKIPKGSSSNIRLGKERSTQQYIVEPPTRQSPMSSTPSVTSNNNSSSRLLLPLLDPRYIFITPPNLETLRLRLANRNTETPQSLELRLRNAQDEMDYGMTIGNFDAVIVNDDLERACEEFVNVVKGLYNRK
jgi:guanylate kinase